MTLAEILYPPSQLPCRCSFSRVRSCSSEQPNQQAHVSAGRAAKCVIMCSPKDSQFVEETRHHGYVAKGKRDCRLSVAELMNYLILSERGRGFCRLLHILHTPLKQNLIMRSFLTPISECLGTISTSILRFPKEHSLCFSSTLILAVIFTHSPTFVVFLPFLRL